MSKNKTQPSPKIIDHHDNLQKGREALDKKEKADLDKLQKQVDESKGKKKS